PPNTCCLFSSLIPLPPTSTLFPYTTLFRSVISKYEVIPMKKMRLIGTIIGVAGAIGAVAAIVYKKFKEKQAMVNTPQEKTLLLGDRKSTRLNSSHVSISYAVFCLKKKNIID